VEKEEASRAIYQLHILLLKISPAIWRRVLVPADQNLADFHNILHMVMGWDDSHLHRFLIHGKEFGVAQPGGFWFSDDPTQIRLHDLHLRVKERFVYEYDFHAFWRLQIRLEKILPFDATRPSPVCIGGARQAPPTWCNGPLAYLEQKQYYSLSHIESRLLEILEDEEARVGDFQEEAATMLFWLQADRFDCFAVNDRLTLFATGETTGI
jgi:Plasmid pRiA4b ORF-3-like protein